MQTLVLYDSQFGNTQKIAEAIGHGIGGDVAVQTVNNLGSIDWGSLKLLVVGSPTQGGRPTPALQQLFDTLPANGLHGVRVAAFDTRFDVAKQNFALRLVMKTIAYAAEKIAKTLETKGGTRATPPAAFLVTGKEGPLKDGELERAEQWGKTLVS